MEPQKAIEFLTAALNNANLKGIFNLNDSVQVVNALQSISEYYRETNEITKDLVRHVDGYISKNLYDKLILQDVQDSNSFNGNNTGTLTQNGKLRGGTPTLHKTK